MAFNAPEVESQPIPSVRLSADTSPTTFGGGPGADRQDQETQQIAGSVGEIATFEKIRADQTAVEDAQSKALGLKQNILYDPQTGVLGSKGTDAVQAHQDGIQNLKKGLNDISSNLNGDQQVGPFNKWAQGLAGTANQTMMTHVDTQLAEHRKNNLEEITQNSAASAALEHGNPQAVDFYRNTANQAALNYAQSSRLDPDETKKLVTDTNDKVQIGVINGMLKFQTYDDAKNYLAANQDNISPKAKQVIQTTMQEGFIRHQATVAANDAIMKNPTSEADALTAINGIQNQDAKAMARSMVSGQFAQDRAAKKNDQDALFNQTIQDVNNKGITDSAQRRLSIPEATWNKFTPEQQRAIEKGGTPDVTSITKWEDFTQSVKDGSLSKMSQADLNAKFMPYMNAADQKTVADYWSGMKKNGGKGGPKEKAYESVLQMQDDALVGIGAMSPKNPTKTQLVFKKQFQDNVDRDLSAQQAALGRPLKQDEIQKVVDQHTLDAIQKQPEGWFPSAKYSAIPDADKQYIVELARTAGIQATKEHVEDAYKMHKQGKSDADIVKALQ